MVRLAGAASLLGLALVAILSPAPAYAQATRTWVSGVGDDVNPCSRTAPCKTFAGAISKTAVGGIINCIDPGGFGALTITKAITVDCQNTAASVLAVGSNGININAPGASVVLRGLAIEGGNGAGLVGINVVSAATVHVEKVRIAGFRTGGATGINFPIPSGAAAELIVSDTTIADCGTSATNGGILVSATGTAIGRVMLSRVHLFNNATGLRVDGGGMTANSRLSVVMRDGAASSSTNAGIHVVAGAEVVITLFDNVASIGNGSGVVASGAGARVLLTRFTAFANNFGLDRPNGGQIVSYLDNHTNGNFTDNGTPSGTQVPQ